MRFESYAHKVVLRSAVVFVAPFARQEFHDLRAPGQDLERLRHVEPGV